ncbi:glycosyltransferase family A protein [Paenibacillus lautus]|uniref:glycosyltransferase family A protein n=1 Tax=Paenibacillus lautus TaxID=1401 RepID=UPI003D290616
MKFTTGEEKSISVLTVTRGRAQLLDRAIKSVLSQTYQGPTQHYILIDDCLDTLRFLEKNYSGNERVAWKFYSRLESDKSGPSLLARLRTSAIHSVTSNWFSFLDDDNEFYPEHLEKLYDFAMENNCNAVHSYHEMLYRDGREYLEQRCPWARINQKERYRELVDMGVLTPGSNIFRDRLGIIIDTNVWLIKRSILSSVNISDEFSIEDWDNNLAEDDKLMFMLQDMNIKVLTNEAVTVKYYLGGYSNVFDGSVEGTILWEKV